MVYRCILNPLDWALCMSRIILEKSQKGRLDKHMKSQQIFQPRISFEHIAGVIDSDGSITISKRNSVRKRPTYTVLLQLTWVYNETTKEYMNQLIHLFGGSYFISDKRYKGRFKNAKPIIKYCATGVAAEKFLKAISSFLWLKQLQAQNALTLLAHKGIDFRSRTQEHWNKFEQLYNNNKFLNSRKNS